jgi:outer membrane protein
MKKVVLLLVALPGAFAAGAQDLLQTYELALQHDPQLAQVQEQRNAALENRPQSVARLLPNLSFTGQMDYVHQNIERFPQRVSVPGLPGGAIPGILDNFWNSSATVQMRQPLFHQDYWVQLSQSENQIAQAEAQYAAEQQNLMLRTTQAYFNVLAAKDSVEFAKAEKDSIGRQLEQAKERFAVGLIAITDVHEAQAAYDQAVATEIRMENDLDNAREALREIIGELDEELSVLMEDLPLSRPEPAKLEDWSNISLQNNLNIIAAANETEVARKNISLQRTGHLPTLDFVGAYNFSDSSSLTLGSRAERGSVGVQMNVPIFQGGAVNSRTRQARHQFEAALRNLDKQRRAVDRTTKNAYRGILSTISQVESLKAAVFSAQSAVEATEAGLEVGTRTMVEVLTEQSRLYAAKRNYSRARYDYIINGFQLKQAAGILTREDIELVNKWLQGS